MAALSENLSQRSLCRSLEASYFSTSFSAWAQGGVSIRLWGYQEGGSV